MAITSLAVTSKQTQNWNCSNTVTGLSSSTTNASQSNVSQDYTTAIANNALGGADEFFNFLTTITAGASATLDLTAMTNVLQQATIALVRVKSIQIQLLSVAQDDLGTACSGITYGALGTAVANANQLGLGGGSGLTLNITAVAGAITAATIVAAGTGYPKSAVFNVVVIQSTATAGLVAATTNSSGVVTSVAVVSGGAAYTTGTPVATFVQSFRTVSTGGSVSYYDQTTGGFAVSSTAKNIAIQNNDAVVAAAVRIQVVGCTS